MTAAILQNSLPFTPWADPGLARMPGMVPAVGPWIVVDEAYAPQIAERRRLMAERRADVFAALPGTEGLLAEVVDTVLSALPPVFRHSESGLTTPDGRALSARPSFADLAGIVQEDLLVLTRAGPEHVLQAGLLCFPASWTLAEKLGRPLSRIHRPVPDYPEAPVQRLFDRLPRGQALWRANALGYADPALYQTHAEAAPRPDAPARYLRCERQTVLKLPDSGAILFAVHTYLLRPEALTPEQRATCPIPFAKT